MPTAKGPDPVTTSPDVDPRDFPDGYYAIADPDDPDTITLWKRTTRTKRRFTPWQARARYGPMSKITRADIPTGRAGEAYLQQIRYASMDWYRRLYAALAADLPGAMKLFAKLTEHCHDCGRALTDPGSKFIGIGPDCRQKRAQAATNNAGGNT
jgi:hypothetical protein